MEWNGKVPPKPPSSHEDEEDSSARQAASDFKPPGKKTPTPSRPKLRSRVKRFDEMEPLYPSGTSFASQLLPTPPPPRSCSKDGGSNQGDSSPFSAPQEPPGSSSSGPNKKEEEAEKKKMVFSWDTKETGSPDPTKGSPASVSNSWSEGKKEFASWKKDLATATDNKKPFHWKDPAGNEVTVTLSQNVGVKGRIRTETTVRTNWRRFRSMDEHGRFLAWLMSEFECWGWADEMEIS